MSDVLLRRVDIEGACEEPVQHLACSLTFESLPESSPTPGRSMNFATGTVSGELKGLTQPDRSQACMYIETSVAAPPKSQVRGPGALETTVCHDTCLDKQYYLCNDLPRRCFS